MPAENRSTFGKLGRFISVFSSRAVPSRRRERAPHDLCFIPLIGKSYRRLKLQAEVELRRPILEASPGLPQPRKHVLEKRPLPVVYSEPSPPPSAKANGPRVRPP